MRARSAFPVRGRHRLAFLLTQAPLVVCDEAERIRLGLPRAPRHALQQMAHQQAAANAANGQSPTTTETRPQTDIPAGTTPPASAAPTDVPDIDPALIIGTQEVFLYGPIPPPPHITVAPGHLLWSLDGLNWVAATCPDHFFQQVATYGDVQVRARPLGAVSARLAADGHVRRRVADDEVGVDVDGGES